MDIDFISVNDSDDDLVPLPTDWTNLPRKSNLDFMQNDESSKKQILLPVMPWKDWKEFKHVYHNLFDHFCQTNPNYNTHNTESQSNLKSQTDSLSNLKHSYAIVEMWRSRTYNHLPICVDITQQLMHSLYLFNGDNESLRRLLALNITRATNRLIDKKHGKSTMEWSRQLAFPSELISIRHDIVHERLPSLYTLQQHSVYLVQWLHAHYWQYCMDKLDGITHKRLTSTLIKLRSRNTDFCVMLQFISDKGYNKLWIMQYFIPIFVEECLTHIAIKSGGTGYMKLEDRFTSLFVKYNTFIGELMRKNGASLMPYLVLVLAHKRYELMVSESVSECDKVRCDLMAIWCHSLLMDKDYNPYWKVLKKEQVVFVFKKILKYAMYRDDHYSIQIIQSIHKKAKQFHVLEDIIPVIKAVRAMQMYVQPLKRDTKSDEAISNLIKDRMESVECDDKLMSLNGIKGLKDEMNEDEEQDSDMDEDKPAETEDIDKIEQCKWRKSNDCCFLPMGHSVLPPL
eukprot:34554_1